VFRQQGRPPISGTVLKGVCLTALAFTGFGSCAEAGRMQVQTERRRQMRLVFRPLQQFAYPVDRIERLFRRKFIRINRFQFL